MAQETDGRAGFLGIEARRWAAFGVLMGFTVAAATWAYTAADSGRNPRLAAWLYAVSGVLVLVSLVVLLWSWAKRLRVRPPVYTKRTAQAEPADETTLAVHADLSAFYRGFAEPPYSLATQIAEKVNERFRDSDKPLGRVVAWQADAWLLREVEMAQTHVEQALLGWEEFLGDSPSAADRERLRRLLFGRKAPTEPQEPFWDFFFQYWALVAWIEHGVAVLGEDIQQVPDYGQLKRLHDDLDREARRLGGRPEMERFRDSTGMLRHLP
ncbi:MAG: hypothetical protein WD206_07240 [Actinomycetota bacterium]